MELSVLSGSHQKVPKMFPFWVSKHCGAGWLTLCCGKEWEEPPDSGVSHRGGGPWPSIAPSAHVPLSPHLYATAQYFSCSLSHYLFSVSLGNQTGVQSTFTTFYEVECDVIDGGRASQLSTHPPTCAEGATLETGSGDSSTVSNLLSHLFLYSSGGGGKTRENGGFFG